MKKNDAILLAHGGGGELTHKLLEEHVLPVLGNEALNPLTDSAVLPNPGERICMTTDGYVVTPLEFPGGDIGKLCVCGTVNDLAVMGAKPLGLSLSLIIEEGLKLDLFDRIIASIAEMSTKAGVNIVTGDTKVVERRSGDGLFITTAGIGVLPENIDFNIGNIVAGDKLLINGNIAEHGLAVMSEREGLAFSTKISSDVAPLNRLIQTLLDANLQIRFIRDLTRAGLAGCLADICEGTGQSVEIDEKAIPMTVSCKHASEMLGLDPLTIANEGKILIAIAAEDANEALKIFRNNEFGRNAAIIGEVTDQKPALVELKTGMGGRRIIQRPYGEELPRIC